MVKKNRKKQLTAHMCPIDFATAGTFGTVFESAPAYVLKEDLADRKHWPAYAGQFRPGNPELHLNPLISGLNCSIYTQQRQAAPARLAKHPMGHKCLLRVRMHGFYARQQVHHLERDHHRSKAQQ